MAAPRIDVRGTYQLTIEAPSQCRGLVPEPLLTRRYTAEIKQSGALLYGIVSGANFDGERNFFQGVVNPTTISLTFLSDPYYPDFFYLVEIVDDATYLAISGGALLTANGRNFAGPFSGSFLLVPSNPPRAPPRVRCSGSSRLTLTR